MPRGFSGNLIFAIVARMLCGNHLNLFAAQNILERCERKVLSQKVNKNKLITLINYILTVLN